MEFPEVKSNDTESSEKAKFQSNANEEVDFKIYTPERDNLCGRKLKRKRRSSRRREAKRTMRKSGNQRNEVDTMVEYCTDFPPPPLSLNAAVF